MLFRIKCFFKYLIGSTNKHGVHPPFIFDLVSNVIESKQHYYVFDEIEALRKHLLNDDRAIEITDLGASGGTPPGLPKGEGQKKQIRTIANKSLKRPKYAQLLFRLVNHFKPTSILELGTSLGVTTLYLAKAAGTHNVITIEGSKNIAAVARENFKKLNVINITSVIGDFDTTLPRLASEMENFDFVFIDGNHRKEATLNYFNWLLPKLHNDSILVFDDIYWSEGMAEAWEEIKKDKRVTSTIDVFEMGIVFLKQELTKQHFVIRY